MAVAAPELRASFHSPVVSEKPYTSTFDPRILEQVIGIIQEPRIVEAMTSAKDPGMIIGGEVGRLRMLSGAFHPDFYHKSIDVLMACGAIEPGYSMIELGTSLAGHLPQIPKDLQPGSMLGFDNKSHIVSAARQTLITYGDTGLLDSGKYEIILGDHTHLNGIRGDVAVLSLTSQYDGGEAGTTEWMMKHVTVAGINGDVVHTPAEISQEELDSGILPIRSRRLPYLGGYTGVNWKLVGDPQETPFGKEYRASLFLDDAVYNENNGIVQIPQPGAELLGKVTIFEREGKLFVEPWAWELTNQATADDIRYLTAIRRTFNEQYSQLAPATNFQRDWESNAALGVPVYAAEKYGYYSAVMFNTATQIAKRSGMLPLAMLRRNGEEVGQIFEAGKRLGKELFSQIGLGKTFADLRELYQVIGKYMSDPQRFFMIVDYTNPLLVTSITTPHRDVFERLQAAA